jgi:putative ABC transport system permease protein
MSHLATAFSIAAAYLREKRLATALNVLLLGLGVGTIIALVLLLAQAEDRMERDSAGIDLVIGAKGSPMQLILSSVFQVDIPTGNILAADAAPIISSPMVKRAVPLALGDSYKGFRIVGTSKDYLHLYQGKVAGGRLWEKPLEAVLGADAARATGLGVGAEFVGTHGLAESGGSEHGDHPYIVVGVLASSGTVMDRLILTDLASVWELHEHTAPPAMVSKASTPPSIPPNQSTTKAEKHQHADKAGKKHDHAHDEKPISAGKVDEHEHEEDEKREVTAYLIQYATPLAAVSFPRTVNATSAMQAASPALESARLFQLVGVGVTALKGFAVVMMVCAGLGIFIGLMNALDERRADLALLRVLGASPTVVVLSTLLQGAILGMLGVILGVMMGHAAAEWIGQTYAASQRLAIGGRVWISQEWWIISGALLLALVASLMPAWRAYRDATPELLAAK